MNRLKTTLMTLSAVFALAIVPALAQAQVNTNPQLQKKIRKELVSLPYYGVFDNLAYSVNGGTVTLYGDVVKPTTKSGAERVVRRLDGVTRVVNRINVLPLSRMDDNIRAATYRSIARTGGLYRYLQGGNPSLHIIVRNGHVKLEGVVDGQGDLTMAKMAANQVPGVFSVTNNLRVEGEGGIGR
jgi:hyperosmotically inducible periplasmic protein